MVRTVGAALATLALSCAGCTSVLGDGYRVGAGNAGSGGGGGEGGGGPTEVDLGGGTWQLENVSNTPSTISHDGVLALLDGVRWVAWAEPDPVALSDQDIWVASRDETGWTGEPRTNDVDVQYAFPSIIAS